jgi:DNA polymerase-3 subunit alpha
VLAERHEGLIGLTACLKGEVNQALLKEQIEDAEGTARLYRDIFGEGNFFLEVQNHDIPDELTAGRRMVDVSKATGIPLVVTNDFHYLDPVDAEAHDVLLAIGHGKTIDDPKRLRYRSEQMFLKSQEQMWRLFGSELPQALTTTRAIADRCNLELQYENRLPVFPLPEGERTAESFLDRLAEAGLVDRYGRVTPELKQRLDYELAVIAKLGFASYFLIVRDFIHFARSQKIGVGPGRGSVAGSLVAYCLRITDIDPIRYGLIFERFLNPERVSMPDIDLDFEDARRGEVIEYVRAKYGASSVSQIITFGRMKAKAVIKDVARVLGLPFSEGDRISKLIPDELGITLDQAIEKVPDLKALAARDDEYGKLIRCARGLEGMARHASVHAAGVLIAPGPLTDHVPVFRTNKDEITTQWDMRSCEKAGLLKMDFLGLRTMTVLDETARLVSRHDGVALDVPNLPLDDRATLDLLGRAQTVGVFQLESSGMRDLLRKLQPQKFEDVSAVVALYRPGPMEMIPNFLDGRHGRRLTDYGIPAIGEVLDETYGVMVYQEQVMTMASRVAGFSMSRADVLRKAMGKKDPKVMAAQEADFVSGAKANGIPEKKARALFKDIEKFAGYGFNKSHSAAYALLAYQTGYLKAHHPVAFMAANLSSEIGDSDRVAVLIEETRRMSIALKPPCVHASDWRFDLEGGAIRFGLGAVKNTGEAAIRAITRARAEGGPFKDLFDFAARVENRALNRRLVESLVQAGAFDALGPDRARLFACVPLALDWGARRRQEASAGQESLFGGGGHDAARLSTPPLPDVPPWNPLERAAREKEVLGFYLSGASAGFLCRRPEAPDLGHRRAPVAPGAGRPRARRRRRDRAAQDRDQEGRPDGVRHARGHVGLDRAPGFPRSLRALGPAPGRRRDRVGQGAGLRARHRGQEARRRGGAPVRGGAAQEPRLLRRAAGRRRLRRRARRARPPVHRAHGTVARVRRDDRAGRHHCGAALRPLPGRLRRGPARRLRRAPRPRALPLRSEALMAIKSARVKPAATMPDVTPPLAVPAPPSIDGAAAGSHAAEAPPPKPRARARKEGVLAGGPWLDFEKPVVELEQKIAELKSHAQGENLAIDKELAPLEARAEKLRHKVYDNLTRYQRVQLARHPRRPYLMDYVERLVTDWTELHGDRGFADDRAIVGGLGRFEGEPLLVVGTQKGRDTKENLLRRFGMANPRATARRCA